MSSLWSGAVILLALAAVFVLFPGWFVRARQHRTLRADNLDWYAQRQRELASEPEFQQLLQDAQLRLLEDGVDTLGEEQSQQRAWRGRLLLLPLLMLSPMLYLQLGAAPDVELTRGLQAIGEDSTEEEFRQLMKQVEVRAGQRPDKRIERRVASLVDAHAVVVDGAVTGPRSGADHSVAGDEPGALRQPQQFPVIIDLGQDVPTELLRVGAQASVMVFTGDYFLLNPIGRFLLRFFSLMRVTVIT